jgi:hypothetical protein
MQMQGSPYVNNVNGSEDDGDSTSTSGEENVANAHLDYAPLDRLQRRSGGAGRQSRERLPHAAAGAVIPPRGEGEVAALGSQARGRGESSRRRPGVGRVGAGVRLFTNPCPDTTPMGRGPSGRFSSRGVGLGWSLVEDITATDPPPHEIHVSPSDSPSTPVEAPQPAGRQTGVRRSVKRKKNGNWSDEQLSAAIAAFDNGMTMKKTSEQFQVPYTSFREHVYGMRKSRTRGAKGVLSEEEERQLTHWLISMVERGYGLSPTTLKMKVSEITMSRDTPFREGIPGGGWMRGWRRRHPELTLRVSQALETARARGLCRDNVKSFYDNLVTLYNLHKYSPDRFWNCDESGAQAGKNGGGVVIARTGARRVHSVVPDQREWLSVLVCINAAGVAISSFYIFRGKRFGQNYIQRCEPGATMAMQPRAWMTSYLFSAWMSRFIDLVRASSSISPDDRHLFILDGHISHVSVEVVQEARRAGLDILTLPSHTSHTLQPLDVSVLKPFKQYFRQYRDYWMFRNLNEAASKDTLAQWVSLSLKKALTEGNIKNGFVTTGIWPLNEHAVDTMLAPSEAFRSLHNIMHGAANTAGGSGLDTGNREQPRVAPAQVPAEGQNEQDQDDQDQDQEHHDQHDQDDQDQD